MGEHERAAAMLAAATARLDALVATLPGEHRATFRAAGPAAALYALAQTP